MSVIKRGTITVRSYLVSPGRAYSYVVQCGACGLEAESPPTGMPNETLAYLRGLRSAPDVLTDMDHDVGRPWLIIDGNDANGGNFRPFVRCGACRTDPAWVLERLDGS